MTAKPPATALSGRQRRALRAQANALHALVQVGAAGPSEGVLEALERALDDHELVKVRIAGERDERSAIAHDLARRSGSALAGLVGRVAILYRPCADPARRRIALPDAGDREDTT